MQGLTVVSCFNISYVWLSSALLKKIIKKKKKICPIQFDNISMEYQHICFEDKIMLIGLI